MTIELLRARALEIASRAYPDDPEKRANHVRRIGEFSRANLESYITCSQRTPREWSRLQMTPDEAHADEIAETIELAELARSRLLEN